LVIAFEISCAAARASEPDKVVALPFAPHRMSAREEVRNEIERDPAGVEGTEPA
jgi:hypothetical protein